MSETTEKTNNWEQFLKHLPLITAVLIFLSFYKLHCFYREFNVDVYEYLTMAELLLLFLPNMQIIITTVLSFLIGVLTITSFKKPRNEEQQEEANYSVRSPRYYFRFLRPSRFKRLGFKRILLLLKRILQSSWPILGVAFMLFLLSYGGQHQWFEKCTDYVYDDSLFSILLIAALFLLAWVSMVYPDSDLGTWLSVLLTIYLILWGFKRISVCDANDIKAGNSPTEIEFEFEGEWIRSTGDTLHMGSTHNYLFLYENVSEKVLIYDKNKISRVTIK